MVEKGIRYEKLLSTNSHRLLLTAPDRTAKLGNVDDAVHPMDAVNLRQLSTYGVSIQDEGVILVKRPTLNFIGAGVSAIDDLANNRINITITTGSTIALTTLGVGAATLIGSVLNIPTNLGSLFTADIPVILSGGKTFGKYLSGQTVPAIGKTAQQVLLDVAQEFVGPSIGFGITSGTIKEKGVAVTSVSMNYSTAPNSAIVTLRKLLKNATVINNPVSDVGSFTDIPVNIIFSNNSGDRTYSYQVDYSNASTQTSSNTIEFYAPSFYGTGSVNALISVTTIAQLDAALASSKEIRTSRSKSNVTFNPVLSRYFFVYPSAFGNLASIIDQNSFNITAGFTLSNKVITLADGITNETYNVYISNTDTSQTNFVITFN